jgi:dihydrofolate reductase
MAQMRKLIFSMSASLDGYVAGPGGDITWGAPDEELHRFHNDRVRELGGHLLGRRLYETMLYWETEDPTWGPTERDFAAVWKPLPKIVYSTTLDEVVGSNVRLAREVVAEEIEALKAQPGKDLEVGGATLAAECSRLGLIDEYQLFVSPVVLGAGTPYFGALEQKIDLELVETRTFGSKVVYLRYRRGD